MEKEKLLELIELKIKYEEAKRKHEELVDEAFEEGSYRYAEGYTDEHQDKMRRLEKEIKDLKI